MRPPKGGLHQSGRRRGLAKFSIQWSNAGLGGCGARGSSGGGRVELLLPEGGGSFEVVGDASSAAHVVARDTKLDTVKGGKLPEVSPCFFGRVLGVQHCGPVWHPSGALIHTASQVV